MLAVYYERFTSLLSCRVIFKKDKILGQEYKNSLSEYLVYSVSVSVPQSL